MAAAEVTIEGLKQSFQTMNHRVVRESLYHQIDSVAGAASTNQERGPLLPNLGSDTVFVSLKSGDPVSPKTNEF